MSKSISPLKGIVFNTQKFSIHDGKGIRTLIFMKGCPLSCIWCSNPESQKAGKEIMDVKSNCTGCGKCANLCDVGAINPESFDIDRNICVKCGKCADYCFANAKKVTGTEVTIAELMKEIEKDRIFFRNSGGGVTVGGGEPAMQAEFVTALLKRCKQTFIHTAIETCGYASWEAFREMLRYTDQLFMDIKCMDSAIHKKYTGVSNELILENAAKAAATQKDIVFRVPMIPGVNDSEENIRSTGEFVAAIAENNPGISMELLPYHDFGRNKYKWLNREYKLNTLDALQDGHLEKCKEILREMSITVV